MNNEQARQDQIFDEVIQITDPGQREKRMVELCGHDEQLRREIQDLLYRDQQIGSFLEKPPTVLQPENDDTTPNADSATPPTILNYRLLKIIGQGGMGTVWLAEQEKPVQRQVALKLIRSDTNARQIISRFEAEHRHLH